MTDDKRSAETKCVAAPLAVAHAEVNSRFVPETERAVEMLGVLVEEWGHSRVKVLAPQSWEAFGFKSLGPVQLIYGETAHLSITVAAGGQLLRYSFPI